MKAKSHDIMIVAFCMDIIRYIGLPGFYLNRRIFRVCRENLYEKSSYYVGIRLDPLGARLISLRL